MTHYPGMTACFSVWRHSQKCMRFSHRKDRKLIDSKIGVSRKHWSSVPTAARLVCYIQVYRKYIFCSSLRIKMTVCGWHGDTAGSVASAQLQVRSWTLVTVCVEFYTFPHIHLRFPGFLPCLPNRPIGGSVTARSEEAVKVWFPMLGDRSCIHHYTEQD